MGALSEDAEVEFVLSGSILEDEEVEKGFVSVWRSEQPEPSGFFEVQASEPENSSGFLAAAEGLQEAAGSIAGDLANNTVGVIQEVVGFLGFLTTSAIHLPAACITVRRPPPPSSPPPKDGPQRNTTERWTRNVPLRSANTHMYLLNQLQREVRKEQPGKVPRTPNFKFEESITLSEARLRAHYGLKPKHLKATSRCASGGRVNSNETMLREKRGRIVDM